LQQQQEQILHEMRMQPEEGWENVKEDTVILVRDSVKGDWRARYFKELSCHNKISCFIDGQTSKTCTGTYSWKYAMLIGNEK